TPEPPAPPRPAAAQHDQRNPEHDQRRRDPQPQHEFGNSAAPAAQIADRERYPSPGVEPNEPVAQQRAEPGDQQHPPKDAADDHRVSITDELTRADALLFYRPDGKLIIVVKRTKPSNRRPATLSDPRWFG